MCTEFEPVYRGNTIAFEVVIEDESTTPPTPVDITLDTIILTYKNDIEDLTPVLTITNTVHSDPLNGTTAFVVPASTCALFEERYLAVEITWVRPGNVVLTIIEGTQLIMKPVREP